LFEINKICIAKRRSKKATCGIRVLNTTNGSIMLSQNILLASGENEAVK
jgi:hypothetical protein